MTQTENSKQYDLEERCFTFALNVRKFIAKIPKNLGAIEDSKQVIRSSGSVGANYIEANESLSKKDFVNRIRICRKEAKETQYWLRLFYESLEDQRHRTTAFNLADEAKQLMMIFGAILQKSVV